MIKLAKKQSFNDWIEVDEVKFLIDYPNRVQYQKLKEIMTNTVAYKMQEPNASITEKAEITAKILTSNMNYMRYYLKCTIKDWQGIDEPCRIVNGELDLDLWERLTSDDQTVKALFEKIESELEFLSSDKKKLKSQPDSTEKAD